MTKESKRQEIEVMKKKKSKNNYERGFETNALLFEYG